MNPNQIWKRLCLVAAVEATGEAAVQQPQYVMDGYGLTPSRERTRRGREREVDVEWKFKKEQIFVSKKTEWNGVC